MAPRRRDISGKRKQPPSTTGEAVQLKKGRGAVGIENLSEVNARKTIAVGLVATNTTVCEPTVADNLVEESEYKEDEHGEIASSAEVVSQEDDIPSAVVATTTADGASTSDLSGLQSQLETSGCKITIDKSVESIKKATWARLFPTRKFFSGYLDKKLDCGGEVYKTLAAALVLKEDAQETKSWWDGLGSYAHTQPIRYVVYKAVNEKRNTISGSIKKRVFRK